jgi:16S rRNA (guanine(1405)-N(7))-methyltransferase
MGERRGRDEVVGTGRRDGLCRSAEFSLRVGSSKQTELCTPAKSATPVSAPADPLDRLTAAVRESAKYRHVCEELIRRLGARELTRRRSLKEAIKATKNVLHQVGGAYQTHPIDYPAALAELRQARQSADPDEWRRACMQIMSGHASTRERLPILEQFYATILADLPPVRSVLDLACGLNPLCIPWMPLAPDAVYYACDVYGDMVGFLNEYMALAQIRGCAEVVDVTSACPDRRVDLALLLKSLPCLEQIESGSGVQLLESAEAAHVLVSFPARSLGGKKGMKESYQARFQELMRGRAWSVRRFELASELAFLMTK